MARCAPREHPTRRVPPWGNRGGQGCSPCRVQRRPAGGRDVPIAPRCLLCLSDWGGCGEKPNCPALLASPGDEREATNSFAELLRYLISSNCSWEDRGKERDSAADGGKGKRMVEMGRKKRLGGGGGWKSLGRGGGTHEEGKANGGMMDANNNNNKKKEKPGKQRNGGRNKGKEGETKRAARCQPCGAAGTGGPVRWERVPARPHPGPAEPGCAGDGGQRSCLIVGWHYSFGGCGIISPPGK